MREKHVAIMVSELGESKRRIPRAVRLTTAASRNSLEFLGLSAVLNGKAVT